MKNCRQKGRNAADKAREQDSDREDIETGQLEIPKSKVEMSWREARKKSTEVNHECSESDPSPSRSWVGATGRVRRWFTCEHYPTRQDTKTYMFYGFESAGASAAAAYFPFSDVAQQNPCNSRTFPFPFEDFACAA